MESFLKLTEKARKQFNTHLNKLFSKLDYDSNSIYIKGSFIIPVLSFFAGDVDLYEKVPWNKFDSFYKHLMNTINDMEDNIEFIEIHDQFEGTPKQFKKLGMDQVKNMLQDSEKRIHLEFAFFENGFIKNVSIMYDFNYSANMKVNKVITDLFNVIEDKLQKSVFKALKRTYTMLVLMPETAQRKKALNKISGLLSNPVYGNLYLAITYLTALEDDRLFGSKEKNESLQNIKEIVRKTGLMTDAVEKKFKRFSKNAVNELRKNLRAKLNNMVFSDPVFQSI